MSKEHKKVIHLSDLHVGFGDCGRRFHEIVTNMIFIKEPASDYVVVITGDLVDRATDSANYLEVSLNIERLRRAGFTVLMAPGNHDYGTGSLGDRRYIKEFKQTFYGGADFEYPRIDIVGDIIFIGLDSMESELHWDDSLWAQGELGRDQLKRLKTKLKELPDAEETRGLYRVLYLHHHPFDPRPLHELKDSAALEKALAPYHIDALLFGHNHDAQSGKKWNGKWGIHRCYDGGTSTGKLGKPAPHRVIDLARDARDDYDVDFLSRV